MGKQFTQEEITLLENNPNVKNIRENRLTPTYEFRLKMYEAWILKPSTGTLRKVLIENGLDPRIVGSQWICDQSKKFKKYGKPSNGKNKVLNQNALNFRVDKDYDDYLISTGKFEKGKNGIRFTEHFINEIYHEYPTVSIDEHLVKYGINPEKVGYQRIYQLKQRLEGNSKEHISIVYDEAFISNYKEHPYISRCTEKQFSLNNHFYDEAALLASMHIDDILDVFEINHKELDISLRNRIKYKLTHWKSSKKEELSSDKEVYLKIQRNKVEALLKIVYSNFEEIKKMVPSMNCNEKKALCQWMRRFPVNRYEFTTRKVLKMIGLSKSQYYYILGHEDYGQNENNKKNQDDKDVEVIKQVLGEEVYSMGHRMVYMKMKASTGQQFGKNKILRLMKKYDLCSKIRKPKQSRIEIKKQLEERKKPNLLKREFRLHRPFEVVLTDVSYIKYGENKTAYLSALKDSSSGRVYTMDVSDSNGLTLVEETLNSLEYYEFKDNSIFHSDQGTLYLTPSFQNKVIALGFHQSMSKRGNCWDNAPQESFFGHFKDECRDLIQQCETLDDLKAVVSDYMTYYNERRPQWNRNKMTPIEFEKYLLDMNDDEFNRYLDKEREKYDKMMERAKEKAVARATDIGAFGG